MATKKYVDLAEMSDADLKSELDLMRTQYQKLNFDHTIKGLDNPATIKGARRDIARLLTEVRRREVVAMTPAQLAQRSKIRARRKKA
jgi:large subunit ribosomal protein L29